jgi:hypothetical protein
VVSRRDEWRTEVIRSSLISDSVRVVLLVLADTMTDTGCVSVPRSRIAAAINRSPRRVTERLELAREAGYLAITRAGKPGQTAAYMARLPDLSHGADGRTKPRVRTGAPQHGADSSHHSWRTGAPTKPDTHGADGGPANTRARSSRNDNQERTEGQKPSGCVDCSAPDPFMPIAGRCRTCHLKWARDSRQASA